MASPIAATTDAGIVSRLAEIDETCRHGLYLIALRALGDDDEAREMVQETLVRTIEALTAGRVPRQLPVPSFAHGIARHVIADVIRNRVRHATVSLDGSDVIPGGQKSPLDALVSSEETRRLAQALQQLPVEDRQLLERCYVRGEGLVEIARASGEPSDRIRKRKSRAIERLRALMSFPRHDSAVNATEKA